MIPFAGEIPHASLARTGLYSGWGVRARKGIKWLFEAETSEVGLSRPCVTRHGLVVSANGSGLWVLEAETGRILWTRAGRARWPLLLDEKTLLFETEGGRLNATDVFSGSDLWQIETGPILEWPTLTDRTAFLVQDSAPGIQDGGLLSAWDVRTGAARWQFPVDGYSIASLTTLRGDGLFFFAEGGSHSGSPLFALDAATGKTRWETYDMPLSPVAPFVGHRLLYADNGGGLKGLDGQTGATEWEYDWEDKEDDDNWGGALAVSPPASIGDRLFFRTMDAPLLCAVDRRKKRLKWTRPLPEDFSAEMETPPSIAGGIVYCAVGKTLYATDQGVGTPLWEWEADQPITSEIVIDGETVYFAAGNTLVALH